MAPLHARAAERFDDYPVPPMLGALEIYRHENALYDTVCSAGFVTQGSINPANFWLLTAGHCGPQGSLWMHDEPDGSTYSIGRTSGNELYSGSDADAQDITLKSVGPQSKDLPPRLRPAGHGLPATV